MRHTGPLILGAGPAGCAAAIALAKAGAQPLLIDRDAQARDVLCGGFLSWQTAGQLRALGIDCTALDAHRVTTLRLFANGKTASIELPAPAFGLSRRTLDDAMRERAVACGTRFAVDTVRSLEGSAFLGTKERYEGNGLMLATGKHDLRGVGRPRQAKDPALGLRLRLPATVGRAELLSGAIELHLFDGGYAGIMLQEDGTANCALAMRKSRFKDTASNPQDLLASLATRNPELAQRLGDDWRDCRIDTIGAVPYGFVAQDTAPGEFLLGDQAAVIPSLAGEGIGIALASGTLAARHWLEGGGSTAAQAYQRAFASRASRPVRMAARAWRLAERPSGHALALFFARHFPAGIGHLMRLTRISPPASLAPASVAAKTAANFP